MPRASFVRLFDEDPDLIAHLEPALGTTARRRVVAPVYLLALGGWEPELKLLAAYVLGLLVLEGVLVRRVEIAGRRAAELVGPGDFISPRFEREVFNSVLPARVSWLVVEPSRVAILDAGVQATVRALPGVMQELFGRAVNRTGAVTSQRAITRMPRLEIRLLCLLWQLADRWGRRSADGVNLMLPLTHELLSDLAAANRSAVSRALGRLAAAELVSKEIGCWKLHGSPPLELATVSPAEEALDESAARSASARLNRAARHS